MNEPPPPENPPPDVVSARPIHLGYAKAIAPASPLILPTLSRRSAAVDLAIVLLVTIVAMLRMSVAVIPWSSAAEPEEPLYLPPSALMIQEWFQLLVAAGLVVVLLRWRKLPSAAFGLHLQNVGRQLLWGAAGLGLTYCWMVVSLMLIFAVLLLYPAFQEDLMKRQQLLELLPIDSLWRTIVLMIPVAANEEIIFRGLLLPYLRRITGYWWPAILISTTVFALLHFQQGVLGILQISGVAAIFALVFVYSRSLLATIVAHFGFNVGQVLFMRFAEDMIKANGQ